jgi:type I restriction-modification system DNA methylase subunit
MSGFPARRANALPSAQDASHHFGTDRARIPGSEIFMPNIASKPDKNKFCKLRNLRNESDVEQNFIVRLLDDLGFTEDFRETKTGLRPESIDKGRRRRLYVPDYVCYLDKAHKLPGLVVDAKRPTAHVQEGVADAQLYASVLRRKLGQPKPDQFCLGSNGTNTVVLHYDSEVPRHALAFADFSDGNPLYEAFKVDLCRTAVTYRHAPAVSDFIFKKPDVKTVRALFEACHDVIWKREFESPVPAFWEFCKLMFIKLHEDRRLHADDKLQPLLQAGLPLPTTRVIFSVDYLDRVTNDSNPNPIAAIFETIRDELETQVLSGKKKRIFNRDERLKLEPLTIRRVVGLLEHHDLIQIDEDLNGRLFQTFLSATMRGKQLGQFFTPRTVVEFMCDLAELRVTKEPPYAPLVLDACCGTGGFLIEAMAKLTRQLKEGPLAQVLSEKEKRKIDRAIKDDRLLGIDAGKDPPVARIARINMYLHGDGGSRIYSADALDKSVRIPATASPEQKEELRQLQGLLTGPNAIQVDVVLTNPPFSMKKEAKETDQREILQEYESAFVAKSGSKKLRPSLKSNVMFLERYHDLLRPGGRFITVIDESVLNTITAADHRARLFRHFYIRAVISLPQDAFVEAGANVKTSILFLDRKEEPGDDQPVTFYGRSENIGYKGARLNESVSDLPQVFAAFREFQQTGQASCGPKAHWTDRSRFFAIRLYEPTERMDFEWHDPRHTEMERRLRKIAEEKGYVVQALGGEGGLCSFVGGKTGDEYVSEGVPILKVRNVTGEGIDWNTDFVLPVFYEANPATHVQRGDVLVTTTGLGTIGRVALFDTDEPCMTDGHITTLRLAVPRHMDPDFLVHYLRSPLGQMQMDRYTVGCTGQVELNDRDLRQLKVIYPKDSDEQNAVLSEAKQHEETANRHREEHQRYRALSRTEFERLLGL